MTQLEQLRLASQTRQKEFGPNPTSALFRATELGGEVGEVLNEVKKLERSNLGMKGGKIGLEGLKEELGDVIISADILAAYYGISLWDVIVDKFNKTSDKHGFTTKISPESSGE